MTRSEFIRLRHLQSDFDPIYFDRDYETLDFKKSKVRHIGEHIGKAYVKLYRFKQAKENHAPDNVYGRARNQVKKEVVPDLLIYRTQLANTLELDLFAVVGKRESKAITVNEALGLIGLAGGLVMEYIEPSEHSANISHRSARMNIRNYGLPALHDAAFGIANQFGVNDPDRAHLERLDLLKNQPLMGR